MSEDNCIYPVNTFAADWRRMDAAQRQHRKVEVIESW